MVAQKREKAKLMQCWQSLNLARGSQSYLFAFADHLHKKHLISRQFSKWKKLKNYSHSSPNNRIILGLSFNVWKLAVMTNQNSLTSADISFNLSLKCKYFLFLRLKTNLNCDLEKMVNHMYEKKLATKTLLRWKSVSNYEPSRQETVKVPFRNWKVLACFKSHQKSQKRKYFTNLLGIRQKNLVSQHIAKFAHNHFMKK